MAGRIAIGTSSWADPGFVEEWYPPGMAARDRLGWYAEQFEAVEVNSTFYAVPEERTVRRWAEVTPEGFTFDVKVHRLLSRHATGLDSLPPDLREAARTDERGKVVLTEGLEAQLADAIVAALTPLADTGKLSTLLLQLTPAFKPGAHDLDELAGLVERLAPWRVALEVRHRGWLEGDRLEKTLEWLESHGAAFVCVDGPEGSSAPTVLPALDAVTREDVAYLRAHGRNLEGYLSGRSVAERFAWRYEDDELEEIGTRAKGLAEQTDEVRLMFNNNRGADAPLAARRMRELLGQPVPDPPATAVQERLL
jgi:uncharacterized protein YecE (DUF72 family)